MERMVLASLRLEDDKREIANASPNWALPLFYVNNACFSSPATLDNQTAEELAARM